MTNANNGVYQLLVSGRATLASFRGITPLKSFEGENHLRELSERVVEKSFLRESFSGGQSVLGGSDDKIDIDDEMKTLSSQQRFQKSNKSVNG